MAATITSTTSGDWSDDDTWVGGTAPTSSDNAIIASGHTVVIDEDIDVVDLTVNSGGVLNCYDNLDINGNFTVNGTVIGRRDIEMKTSGAVLDGSGVIDLDNTKDVEVEANMTIASTANLICTEKIKIFSGVTVTNNGTISCYDDVTAAAASSTWVNAANSTAKVQELVIGGILTATSSGNTVNYFTNGNADVTGTTYYNLTIAGSGDKKLDAATTVTNKVLITAANLKLNGFDLSISGDYENSTGTLIEGTNEVIFTGTADQTIDGTFGETFYDLEVNKASGTLTCVQSISVTNTLELTAGKVDCNTNGKTLTLGSGTGNVGTLTYTAGYVYGNFEKWFSGTGSFTFPSGNTDTYRPLYVNFDNMTTAGSFIVIFVASDPGTSGLSLTDGATTVYNTFSEGYWDFSAANSLASTSFDVQATSTGMTSFTIEAASRVLFRTSNAVAWTANGTHVDAAGSVAKRDNITTTTGHICLGDDTNCTGPSTSAVSGDSDVCTSDTGDAYSVTSTSGSTYAWTITGGTQVSGTNTNSITVDWGATGMVGTVAVAETNSCTTGASKELSVTVNSIAPTAVTGAVIIAENTAGEAYSVTNTAGYTYTWTITGGTQASGTTTNAITVDWGSNGTGTVALTATKTGCAASSSYSISVEKYVVITTDLNPSGDHSTAGSWDCNCVPTALSNIVVAAGDSLVLASDQTFNHVTVNAGGVLYCPFGNQLTVDGYFTCNGTLYSNNQDIVLKGNAVIDGTGTIAFESDKSLLLEDANKTVKSTATLVITGGDLKYNSNDLIVTNNGSLTIGDDFNANSKTGGQWINAANSTLAVGDEFANTGNLTFTSSASGNTVYYTSSGSETILTPSGSTYHHLKTANGTFTTAATLDLNGNLTVESGTFDLSASNYGLTIGGNFSNSGTFVERSSTITLDGSAAQTLTTTSAPETLYALTINNTTATSAVTLSGAFRITNALTFTDGQIVTTSVNSLTGAQGITISGHDNDSHVDGPFIHDVESASSQTIIFPVGKSQVLHQADLTIDNDAATSTTYTGEFIATSAVSLGYTVPGTLTGVSSVAHWDISKGAGAGVDAATVKLYYLATDGVSDAGNLAVVKDNGASVWTDLSGTASGSPTGSIVSDNFTTFSKFALGNKSGGGNALPVELINFEAHKFDRYVETNWACGSEVDNDYFTIQRSQDLRIWENIGELSGFGTTSEKTFYDFTDNEPLGGTSYYRLKQTDYNGTFAYTHAVAIEYEKVKTNLNIVLSPNPALNGKTNLTVKNLTANAPIELQIVDELGRLVHQSRSNYVRANGTANIEIQDEIKLPNGVYFVNLWVDGEQLSQRLVNQSR